MNQIANRVVHDTQLSEARETAEFLQAQADHWPDESIWKQEHEMVTEIANKLPVDELSYLIAYIRHVDEFSSQLHYIELRKCRGQEESDNEFDDDLPF